MDFNPIDDIEDAAHSAANAVGRKKRQLVKYISGQTRKGPSIASGQSNTRPKYYTKGRKRPYRRP